jgi:hypothetical protein
LFTLSLALRARVISSFEIFKSFISRIKDSSTLCKNASSQCSEYSANISNLRLRCASSNIPVDPYVPAGCPRFVAAKFALFFFCLEFHADIAFACAHDPMCACASFPQSAKQYAQIPARHLEHDNAKHPVKSTNACEHLGQHVVNIFSITCSRVTLNFSSAPALSRILARSAATRRSVSSTIFASFTRLLASSYALNVSFEHRLAIIRAS